MGCRNAAHHAETTVASLGATAARLSRRDCGCVRHSATLRLPAVSALPPVSNVFGYLRSSVGLRPVAAALCSRLGLSVAEVGVRSSDFDGTETLRIETPRCSLETRAHASDTWLFNGAVAGPPEEILATLLPLVQTLTWAGFSASFEIYDAAFQLVSVCPRID